MSLRPHQEKNVGLLLEALKKHGAALDASDVGTGKSRTFAALCKILGARPGIITRKPIISGWASECRAVGVDPLFITNYEQCKMPQFEFGKLITNRRTNSRTGEESVSYQYEWTLPPRTLLGFDEVQGCRGLATQNSSMLVGALSQKTVLMSATPFTSPLEAYAIGRALRLFNADRNAYYTWLARHGVRRDRFGRLKFVGDGESEKNIARGLAFMEQLHREIFPERGCRTRRQDIPGFPESIIETREVDTGHTTEIEQVYLRELEDRRKMDFARACENVPAELHDLVEVLPITVNLRARQEVELLKVPALVDLAKMYLERGEYVALFVNFDATIEALMQHLDTKCVVRGAGRGRRDENPHNSIQSFQANKSQVIIVNNGAGGAGISLQDPTTQKSRTSLISPPLSAVQLRQIIGRPWRLGGGHSSQYLCFASGTVEDRVLFRVKNKLSCLDALTDGDLDPLVVT